MPDMHRSWVKQKFLSFGGPRAGRTAGHEWSGTIVDPAQPSIEDRIAALEATVGALAKKVEELDRYKRMDEIIQSLGYVRAQQK